MLRARLRSGPSRKVVVMIDRPAGAVNAADAPLRKRVTTSRVPLFDETAERRGDGEDGQRDQQRPPAAEQVGGAPAEQQQAAVPEHVARDDPLQLRGREVQVGVDGGQRDADHRDVEPVEEEHAAQDDEEDGKEGEKRESIQRESCRCIKFSCIRCYCRSCLRLLPFRGCGPSEDDARLVDAWRDLLDRHARTTDSLWSVRCTSMAWASASTRSSSASRPARRTSAASPSRAVRSRKKFDAPHRQIRYRESL